MQKEGLDFEFLVESILKLIKGIALHQISTKN